LDNAADESDYSAKGGVTDYPPSIKIYVRTKFLRGRGLGMKFGVPRCERKDKSAHERHASGNAGNKTDY
jgi:hypothetical protein